MPLLSAQPLLAIIVTCNVYFYLSHVTKKGLAMTKDKNDHLTTDMLQRPRGRPRTGAKSGAERQRAYRKKARAEDMASLSVMVSVEARVSLDALARYHGCSLAEVLEPLLIAEKDRIVQEIYATGSPEEQEATIARLFGLK